MPDFMDEVQLVKILLDIPLFDALDYTQISSILELCRQRETRPGEVLCESRTVDNRLLVLLKGRLRLETAEGGKLSELTPVRVIGEMGVFTGLARSSRVVAEEVSTILELEAEGMEDLLEEDPRIGNHMLASLIKLLYTRLHDINDEMEALQEQVARLRQRMEKLAPQDPVLGELFPMESDYSGPEL